MKPDIVPPGCELGPVLCHFCLHESRAQRTWLDLQREVWVCPVHGDLLTSQWIEKDT